MGYPAEIYISTARGEEITDPAARVDREKAYNIGKTDSESLDGWSKLTQAIQDDLNIDWEKLDGLPAKCVHPELGTLTYKLERDPEVDSEDCERPIAWWVVRESSHPWSSALTCSWKGQDGWTLWIKGEIPLKRKTADQLPNGTCIDGLRSRYEESIKGVVVEQPHGVPKIVVWADSRGATFAEKVEVLKEYGIGTFKETA